MKTAKEYKDSLRDRKIKVYLKGELLDPKTLIDHPFIRGHVNSAAMTYALAGMKEYEELMTATSHLTGKKINRFTHIHQSTDDLVKKVKMLRMISQKTGTCYQRCVGFDAMNATYSVTYEIDQVREPYATWIRQANGAHRKHGVRIVAADCPSGLSAQTGATASECITAGETVTMIVPKTGLLESQARPYVGTLLLAPLISIEEYFDDLL